MNLDDAVLSFVRDSANIRYLWDSGVAAEHLLDPVAQDVLEFSYKYWRDTGLQSAPTDGALQTEFPQYVFRQTEESIVWVVSALKERYANNKIVKILEDSALSIQSGGKSAETLHDIFKKTGSTIQSLTPRRSISNSAKSVEDRRARYVRDIENGGIQGAPLGLDLVDELTGGTRPGELTGVAARLKKGKTFLLVNSFIAARRAGYTPYFATLELGVAEIEDRVDAVVSGVSFADLSRRGLLLPDINIMCDAQDEFAALGDAYIEHPPMGERSVQHLVTRARTLGCNYIIIDQMSFVEGRERHYKSITDRYNEVIVELKNTIADTATEPLPCLLAVQLNRGASSSTGGRGDGEHVGQSDMIGQTVDMLYGLSHTEEHRQNNSAVLDIMASRRTRSESYLLEWQFSQRTAIGVRGTLDDMEGND